MKKIIIVAVCLWYVIPSACTSYTLTHPMYNPGFFSVFNTVLGALDHYDQHKDHISLTINFEDQGHYHDTAKGENWWQYYFEPIKLGNDQSYQDKFPTYQKIIFSLEAQFKMPRERGAELIEKYIRLKTHVQEKLDTFVRGNFNQDPVIGVHYRGTDKKSEAPTVSYNDVIDKLTEEINKSSESKIFVATDDENFLSLMRERFANKILALDAIRSRTQEAVHVSAAGDPYKKGEDAILDCLLLSKCSKLFKMASNLSDTSLKFNPEIPVVRLNVDDSLTTRSKKYSTYSTLNVALSLLNQYEKGSRNGFTVYLPVQKEQGEVNEWEHYFQPLSVGADQVECNSTSLKAYEKAVLRLKALHEMSPSRAHELITRYIRYKPEHTNKIDAYMSKYFTDHVIGIYYYKQPEGILDKIQPTISYEKVWSEIDNQIKQAASERYKLFVCTQDQTLLDALREKYSNVITYQDSEISEAESDLINYRLLSKSDVVIGTGSHQLTMIAQLNPSVTIQELDTCWLEKK